MQYGQLVKPLFLASPGWRFITGDTHDIARRVQEMHSGTRVVGHPQTGYLAIAVWIPRSSMPEKVDAKDSVQEEGGAWILSFRLQRPNGTPRFTLEADVLTELRLKDSHRRRRKIDPRKLYNELEKAHELREEAFRVSSLIETEAIIEERAYANARKLRIPWRPGSIYVPGS
jgi:hypothetical protein